MISKSIKTIQSLIINNNIEDLSKILYGRSPDINLLISRWKKLEKEQRLGIVYRQEYITESTKITYSLLNSLSALEKELFSENLMIDVIAYNSIIENYLDASENVIPSDINNSSLQNIQHIVNDVEVLEKSDLEPYIELIENEISSTSALKNIWYDNQIKDKIKLSIPFLFVKWERELDISGIKMPKNWNDFKSIFIKN